jgi:hypothetical protein
LFKKLPKQTPSQKGQNIYNKASFERPKHLYQTTFETLTYVTAYLNENVINLFNQNVAQNVTISLGYFIFSKPPKVAQLQKIAQFGQPGPKLNDIKLPVL